MGHVRNYTIGDVIARYQRMLGKTSCSRSAGMRSVCRQKGGGEKQHRASAVDLRQHCLHENQLKMLGFGYDWSRELATCPRNTTAGSRSFSPSCTKGLVYKKPPQ